LLRSRSLSTHAANDALIATIKMDRPIMIRAMQRSRLRQPDVHAAARPARALRGL
jgi:hypothetical protein